MDSPIPDEQQLLGRLKSGEEAAFNDIYRRYAARLLLYAGARLFRLEDARDIVQDVFVKLWNVRGSLDSNTNLGAYLYTMTRNSVIDHIRKNARKEEYGILLQSLGTANIPDAAQQLEAKELAIRVEQALGGLSPRVREVYRLSREQHFSIPEIAQQLSISEQTVKNQLTTALNHLRSTVLGAAVTLVSAGFWWLS